MTHRTQRSSAPRDDLPDAKAESRKRARQALAGLSGSVRARSSAAICRQLENWHVFQNARTVLLFSALPDEPDLRPLCELEGCRFAFPRVEDATLNIHLVRDASGLIPSRWNILEPDPSHCPVIPASEIDLALVPGVAFTRAGVRLGRGKGFFDRLLGNAGYQAVTCGVCFSAQVSQHSPRKALMCGWIGW